MFSKVSFIMVAPSHPGNVGSVARAIKNMGFSRLILVNPRVSDVLSNEHTIAMASGADDVLAQAMLCDSLEQALVGTTMACALTARVRDLGPPSSDLRQAAIDVKAHLSASDCAHVAIVMGTERSGLSNEHISLCHRTCHILANPEFSSLNVAQALQLVAYELRYALVSTQDALEVVKKQAFASHDSVQAMLTHLQEALVDVEFLDLAHPKKLIPRIQHLFSKASLSPEEVDILRGICTAMQKTARRAKANEGVPTNKP